MTAGKGGRPRTGSAFERGGRWYIAVSTWRPGEPRKRWKGKCPTAPGVTLTEELARALARDAQERYDRSAWNPYEKPVEPPPAPEGETVEAYAGRWLAEREAKGLRSVVSDRGRLRTHLYPALGARPVAAVTRDELETLRDDLDELVRDGRMAWKTALNTWAESIGGFEGNAQTLHLLCETIYQNESGVKGMQPTRALLDGILTVQLRQLEDNGLTDLPAYREITAMRSQRWATTEISCEMKR